MFPYRPDELGQMAPIPAVATIPPAVGVGFADMTRVAEEVDSRADEFLADLRPRTGVGRFLARRAAALSFRLDRSARQEAAAIAVRVRRAENEFTQNRLAEVDHLFSWINAEPATYARRLRQSPEGLDRLLEAWRVLRSEIADPDFPRWDVDHRMLAESMLGKRSNDLPVTPFRTCTEAYYGIESPYVAADAEFAPLDLPGRQAAASRRLIDLIDAEITRLTVERSEIDVESIALDRAEAADRALFDPSPEATLARRYEQATERGFHRALRAIAALEKAPAPEAEFGPEHLDDVAPDPTLTTPDPETVPDPSARRRQKLAKAIRRSAAQAATSRFTHHHTPPQGRTNDDRNDPIRQ